MTTTSDLREGAGCWLSDDGPEGFVKGTVQGISGCVLGPPASTSTRYLLDPLD
jgi:hypothetical protein